MTFRTTFVSFVSNLGFHKNCKQVSKELGLDKHIEICRDPNSSTQKKFDSSNYLFNRLRNFGTHLSAANGVSSGNIINGYKSLVNNGNDEIPYLVHSSRDSVGKNDAYYFKTRFQVGIPTSKRLRDMKSNYNIERVQRVTSSSMKDYITPPERRKLNFTSGFNQKGFAFLMEDTYFSINDYEELFKVTKNHGKRLEKNINGETDIYGCVLNTKNTLKFKNRMDYYSIHIKIHLIKIIDLNLNVRDLIKEFAHTVGDSSIARKSKSGKIPLDQQYSFPNTDLKTNRFSINFLTALCTNLKLSNRFRERARIAKSWSRTLTPGSIWEFKLKHHMGKGIHLNTMYDILQSSKETKQIDQSVQNMYDIIEKIEQTKNQTTVKSLKTGLGNLLTRRNINNIKKSSEHPAGYVFCIEYVGDRRGSISGPGDSFYSGYAPVNFNMEFDTEIEFLSESDNLEQEKEVPCTYLKTRQETDFYKEGDFADIFYNSDERISYFNQAYKDINITGEKNKKYNLIYDQTIKSSGGDVPNSLKNFISNIANLGLNFDIESDDVNLNTKDLGLDTENNDN